MCNSFKKALSMLLAVTLLFTQTDIAVLADDGMDNTPPLITSGVVTAFEPLADDVMEQTVAKGTQTDELNLPDALDSFIEYMDYTDVTSPAALQITMQVPVIEWESEPDYDPDSEGEYVFTPVMDTAWQLDLGVELPVITVMVEDAPVQNGLGGVITAFEPLNADVAAQTVPFGTPLDDLALPDSLTAAIKSDPDTPVSIPVKAWTSAPDYQGFVGYYVFTPEFEPEWTLAHGVETPTIKVTVQGLQIIPLAGGRTFDISVESYIRIDPGTNPNTFRVTLGGMSETINNIPATETITIVSNGTQLEKRITIEIASSEATLNLELNNVNLKYTEVMKANGKVNLTITGDNRLEATGDNYAGIRVQPGDELTINGTGSLTVIGGDYGAGIGGSSGISGGKVTINGGTVTATGRGVGAGIGGGINGNGGTVTINGGTVTAASVNSGAAGIGGGNGGTGGTVVITGPNTVVTAECSNSDNEKANAIGSGAFNDQGGSLTVSGGATLILNTRGTNASTDFFNCTIGGTGAGSLAGVYGSRILGAQTIAVTAPSTGQAPQTTIASGTGYTGSIAWYNATDNASHSGDFVMGKIYKATVTLITSVDYKWPSTPPAITVAGSTSVSNCQVSGGDMGGNTLTFDVTFPGTKELASAADLSFSPDSATYNENAQGVTVIDKNNIGLGTITVYYTGTNETDYTKSTTPPTNAGTYAITADVAASENYGAAVGLELGNYVITKADIPSGITVTPYTSAFDGSPRHIGIGFRRRHGDVLRYGKRLIRFNKPDFCQRGNAYRLFQSKPRIGQL